MTHWRKMSPPRGNNVPCDELELISQEKDDLLFLETKAFGGEERGYL